MQILIAEDDLTARTMLKGILQKWGFEVVAVRNGQEAWNILQQPDAPRLVILDWMMPELNGPEVINRITGLHSEQPPYIILLSSKDQKADIISGLEIGANDYITKPFITEELYARIHSGQRTLELQTNLYESQWKLAHEASHDPLTGIYNRRAIIDILSNELLSIQFDEKDKQNQISIGYLDVDHFKSINDKFGHSTGDYILSELVKIIRSRLLPGDSIGRLGGDEFLIITPKTGIEKRVKRFEEIGKAIEETIIKTSFGEISLTVSLGVITSDSEENIDQLIQLADSCMYQAKAEGGNRVIFR